MLAAWNIKEFSANAYYQSVGSVRTAASNGKNQVTGFTFMPAKAGCMYPCNDSYTQKAQFGAAESSPCQAFPWD